MQYPLHPLILFFFSILSTTTPTAARPSTPGAPQNPTPILPALAQSQPNTLTTRNLNYLQPKTPPPITQETAYSLHKRRGGEGDNRRGLPSVTPETATPIPFPLPIRRRISANNLSLQQRWLPSITPVISLPLPLPLHKRRGGEGDNRRYLPPPSSTLSPTETSDSLTNPT